MLPSLSETYIKRNAAIITEYLNLVGEGIKTRDAIILVAKKHENVSEPLVKALIFNKKYPYAKEAWEKVNNQAQPKYKSA